MKIARQAQAVKWMLILSMLFSLLVYFTPSPSTAADINLAYGRPVTVSSSESAHPGSNAVDANGNTRWSSGFADNQNFIVDLGSPQTVSSVLIKWEAAYATQFQIQTSTDNVTWTTRYENYNATGGTSSISFPAVTARYVKMFGIKRATAYGFSIWEFEVYGSAAANTVGVLDYLKGTGRTGTVIGEHNREPNSDPAKYTNAIIGITGKTPALWSGDFLFSSSDVSNRQTMIDEAKKQWANGAIVQLMMHVTPPTQSDVGSWDGGVVSELSDSQWSTLITNGGTLNTAWKKRLDTYAGYLQQLEDGGVTVLFRPFHEMNQSVFWWAGRPGTNGTAALYRLTRDYLVNTKGLTNLIWVWDMQDLESSDKFVSSWSSYNPGSSYWDIFALDIYNPDFFTTAKYNAALTVAGGKPIAIGECAKLPSPSVLAAQPKWAFAMGWSEWVYEPINGVEYNTDAEIRAVYHASNVITKDELPKLK
ncbi:glycosyl hydrolase [Paenibacillus methanolicus]|uniref:F5/8 type C domain-containing protein n=1 Tax=Paenibacillus methanolicus TaxID=582686 RepID=A0A5S5CBK1_9BACL|nr:glycosyl hydrolase [Paenibacillus methanolicus]TYP76734.1 F5/8 type C domain-containing protein [Paenibacillus methanolicus]